MQNFQLYAANLFSLDCEKSALLYSKLFSLSIRSAKVHHAELQSDTGLAIFIDKPSDTCKVSPGSISFVVPELNLSEMNLEPLNFESYDEKGKYAAFLDEYSNRIWVFAKNESKK